MLAVAARETTNAAIAATGVGALALASPLETESATVTDGRAVCNAKTISADGTDKLPEIVNVGTTPVAVTEGEGGSTNTVGTTARAPSSGKIEADGNTLVEGSSPGPSTISSNVASDEGTLTLTSGVGASDWASTDDDGTLNS